jgi:hypothetical protein
MGKKFDKLSGKVEREYENKGVSPSKAKQIGNAVAGQIAREKGKTPSGKKGK